MVVLLLNQAISECQENVINKNCTVKPVEQTATVDGPPRFCGLLLPNITQPFTASNQLLCWAQLSPAFYLQEQIIQWQK